MKKIFLICVLFVIAQTIAFSQGIKKALLFEIELFQKEVGILDPLFLNISFGNRGRREILVFPPDGRNMLIEVKRVEGEKWWNIELFKGFIVGENDFKVSIPPGSSRVIPKKLSAPRDSAGFVWMPAKTPEYLFFNNYCFRPGKYELRVTYFYKCLNLEEGKKKNSIVRIIDFEVVEYEDEVDRQAYDWLMRLEHPGLFYNPEVAIYSFESWLEIGKEFLVLFPDSRFAPFVHFGVAKTLRQPSIYRNSLTGRDNDAIDYHFYQARKSSNPFLRLLLSSY